MVDRDKMKKITVFGGCWVTNIGNAFIILGSIQSLREAAPNSIVYNVSEFPRFLFEKRFRGPKEKLLGKAPKRLIKTASRLLGYERSVGIKDRILEKDKALKKENVRLRNLFDIGLAIKSDYAVSQGAGAIDELIRQMRVTMLKLRKKGVKIILNGMGGSEYSKGEIDRFRRFLREIRPYIFISRDERSFANYSDLAEHSYNGIDCGFFISDYFKPAKLSLPKYIVLNFDSRPEPKMEELGFKGYEMVIRTHHRSSSELEKFPKSYFDRPNTLVSDLPDEYLHLYANAEAVFSDRVHACVAAYAFGRPCRLYSETRRALLFDRIGAGGIRTKLTYPNTKRIKNEKRRQVKFLSEFII